ncbi:MAG: tyrosine-type recombinase/integrase [Planctomycetota bacterium]|jgi:site-specific recombinase XerD
MDLEHVSAEKSPYGPTGFRPKPTQLSLFPKVSQRPDYRVSKEQVRRIMARMSAGGLCGREKVGDYLQRQLRHNCRPNTIRSSGYIILLFLEFFKKTGGEDLAEIGPEHISSFVEHEQDRGMSPVSVQSELRRLYAFLNFLVDYDVIGPDVIKRKLRIKVPDALPRAIDPEDIQRLLAVIKKPCDRALILTLLRSGMRIGELLNTKVEDINLQEKWIRIIEARKNRVGRVVYLSADAVAALREWMTTRTYQSEFIFYGRNAGPLCYEAARGIFKSNIAKAGLAHKGYTLHCLRHTYATELLNASMPLQCLQELLGHHSIEITRRYARLTDNSRREAYYQAMAIIEAGDNNGHYQFDYQLP